MYAGFYGEPAIKPVLLNNDDAAAAASRAATNFSKRY